MPLHSTGSHLKKPLIHVFIWFCNQNKLRWLLNCWGMHISTICGVVIDRKERWEESRGEEVFYYCHRCSVECLSLRQHSGFCDLGNSAQGIGDSRACRWITVPARHGICTVHTGYLIGEQNNTNDFEWRDKANICHVAFLYCVFLVSFCGIDRKNTQKSTLSFFFCKISFFCKSK